MYDTTTSAKHLPNVEPMLGQCLRRWPNIGPTLGRRIVFAGTLLQVNGVKSIEWWCCECQLLDQRCWGISGVLMAPAASSASLCSRDAAGQDAIALNNDFIASPFKCGLLPNSDYWLEKLGCLPEKHKLWAQCFRVGHWRDVLFSLGTDWYLTKGQHVDEWTRFILHATHYYTQII